MQTLINLSSKVNAMTQSYAAKPSFKVRYMNVQAQKITYFNLETFGMIFASFQIKDKLV